MVDAARATENRYARRGIAGRDRARLDARDNRATLSQYLQVVDMAYPNRITVGFSYDDAGIGDLDVRKVVVWGDEHDRTVLRNWYQQYYGGVSVEFRALPGNGSWRFGPYSTSAPPSGRGAPRVQYAREYWVVHSQASSAQFRSVASSGYSGRKTVRFSYDDAGIGDPRPAQRRRLGQ